MIRLFDGSNEPEMRIPATPAEHLAAHTAFIERKRQREAGQEFPTANEYQPNHFEVTRIDGHNPTGTPPEAMILQMEGQRFSLVFAALPLDSNAASAITVNTGDGKTEGVTNVLTRGAVGIHLSSGMCVGLVMQGLQIILPRLKPEMAALATKLLDMGRDGVGR